ncbi:hypothetical protein B0H16DRAFT_1487735 [Mycena metata]|uniref:Uncharacterized protein n=1 Tax=Mycena metata TaxID=1033252 RepID=A0AAD7KIL9_9AGAR|nr:hypothetical protein B0H16DRAFT_1487735 [Mycena metata]
MEARPAEQTLAPSRCTLSQNDLSVKEYIVYQDLTSQGPLAVAGGLPSNISNPLHPTTTNAWEAPAITIPVVVALAYEKIIGGNVPDNMHVALVTAIGNPSQVTRGHLFALFRLLSHFRDSSSTAVLCTEYIQKRPAGSSPPVAQIPLSGVTPVSDEPPMKRRRSEVGPTTAHNLLPTDAQLKGLEWASHLVPFEVEHYAEPQHWQQLPFPFCYSALPHDRFSLENARSDADQPYLTFDWMGREVFPLLVNAVARLKTDGMGPSAAFLGGPIGVGKSHLLAALALFLRRQGKTVVYIPHCGDLLQSPIRYVVAALLCAFSGAGLDNKTRRNELRYLKSSEEIIHWCESQTQRGVQFYFIVDQLNGLEPANSGMTPVRQCEAVKSFLLDLYLNNICIRSSSSSDQDAVGTHARGQREVMLTFNQTLTEAECVSWLNRFSQRLPTFEPRELEWFHDFTGRIFMFYSPLLQHPDVPFAEIWNQLQNEVVFETARRNVQQFGANIITTENEAAVNNYIEGVKACITNTAIWGIAARLIDRRYCAIVGGRGHVTCGLARRELIMLLAKRTSNPVLSADSLNEGFTNSPPAPGLFV